MLDDISISRLDETRSPWVCTAVFRIFRSLMLCLNLAIQLASAFSMSNYSPSHTGKGMERVQKILRLWEHWNGWQSLWISGSISQTPPPRLPTEFLDSRSGAWIPTFIIDPSAVTFMSAVMTYCSAVLLYCTMEKGQHRDSFLVFGVLLGTISGTLASWSDSNLELLKDFIPISITAALTMSLVWHVPLSRPIVTLSLRLQHLSIVLRPGRHNENGLMVQQIPEDSVSKLPKGNQ
ncbi:hypothetical protein B0O99DRAFT_91675 [Bisporella sp. PMI_857]|nr:hypothetical protein B0O99DRAFT_91675 [Bisporella sp. PMI_857]